MEEETTIQGFTLLEMALVLVIVGLLVGGVLTGKNLIRAAELRAVSAEAQGYIVAVINFRDKYKALPGDMTNATAVWGAAHANAAVCDTIDSRTLDNIWRTCNGDGDYRIEMRPGGAPVDEVFRFWQQLSNAGLINRVFSGKDGPNGAMILGDAVPGTNVPGGSLDGSMFVPWYIGASGLTWHFGDYYGNVLHFESASYQPSSNATIIMTPQEAQSIDDKIDDGRPGIGKIRTYNQTLQPNCATTNVATTAMYNSAYEEMACGLILVNAF